MIGSGKSHVRTVVSIAQAQSRDQEPPPAIKAFASLGSFGRNNSNEERDMRRWLQRIHGIQLEVHNIDFTLQVLWQIYPYQVLYLWPLALSEHYCPHRWSVTAPARLLGIWLRGFANGDNPNTAAAWGAACIVARGPGTGVVVKTYCLGYQGSINIASFWLWKHPGSSQNLCLGTGTNRLFKISGIIARRVETPSRAQTRQRLSKKLFNQSDVRDLGFPRNNNNPSFQKERLTEPSMGFLGLAI